MYSDTHHEQWLVCLSELKHPEMEDVTHLLSNPYVLVWAVVFILLLLLSLKQLNKYNISDTNTTTTEL